MTLQHILLVVFWISYGVLHSVLASAAVKKYCKRRWGKNFVYYRFVYNIFAFAGLAAIAWYQFSVETVYLFGPVLLLQLVGTMVSIAGLILMIICIKKYFTGLSGLLNIKQKETQPTALIISGVHRYVRHPLYLGTFVFIWGFWLVFPLLSLLLSNTIITLYTLVGIELEEKKLIADFGDDYKTYREKVPRIIPKIAVAEMTGDSHRQKARVDR